MTAPADCPRCSAMLPSPDADGVRVCVYCGHRTRGKVADAEAPAAPRPSGRPVAAPAPPRGVVAGGGPTAPGGATGMSYTVTGPTPARRNGCGCVVPLIILFFVGGIVAMVVGEVDFDEFTFEVPTPSNPTRISGEQPLVLDTGGAIPSVVAVTTRYDSSAGRAVHAIAGFEPDEREPAWLGPPFPTDTYLARLAGPQPDSTIVVAAVGAEVQGLDLASGEVVWSTPVSDQVRWNCETCLWLGADVLVVVSSDGVAHGLDPATGEVRWERRLEAANAQVHLIPSGLLVFDDVDGPRATLVDPVSGMDRAPVPVTCDDPASGRNLRFDVGAQVRSVGDLTLIGWGFSPGCWQAFSGFELVPVWTSVLDGGRVERETVSAVGGGRFWVGDGRGRVVGLDLASGQQVTIEPPQDAELIPLDASEEVLVIGAKRTRGTELWWMIGADPVTGEPWWQTDPGPVTPADPALAFTTTMTGGDARFAVHAGASGVWLLVAERDSSSITVQGIDARSGERMPVGSSPLETGPGSVSFAPLAWTDDTVTVLWGSSAVVVSLMSGQQLQVYGA